MKFIFTMCSFFLMLYPITAQDNPYQLSERAIDAYENQGWQYSALVGSYNFFIWPDIKYRRGNPVVKLLWINPKRAGDAMIVLYEIDCNNFRYMEIAYKTYDGSPYVGSDYYLFERHLKWIYPPGGNYIDKLITVICDKKGITPKEPRKYYYEDGRSAQNKYLYKTTFDAPFYYVPVRSRPNVNSEEFYSCPKNSTVFVIERGHSYYKVKVNGFVGYVSKALLKKK